MTDGDNGLVQILQIPATNITSSDHNSFSLRLNNTLQYYIGFMDPTFAVMSGNPETIPWFGAFLPSDSGSVYVHLKVRSLVISRAQTDLSPPQAVLHSTLNMKTSPCLESPQSSYATCVNRRIAQEVGCQTFWTNYPGKADRPGVSS